MSRFAINSGCILTRLSGWLRIARPGGSKYTIVLSGIERRKPRACAYGGPASSHVYYEGQNPRESRIACRSMTPEQYADFQRTP